MMAIRATSRPRPDRHDLIAGLSVALVLIPQSLAYAGLAGLPVSAGIYSAMVAPLLAFPLSSSPYLQTGPTAVTSLLTLGALRATDGPSGENYLGLAALLALIVGSIRVMAGLLRLGGLGYLLSRPVILGFTTAAGTLIVASQVPAVLGVPTEFANPLAGAFVALQTPAAWNGEAIILAVVALASIRLARRVHPLVPGVLIAVALGSGYSAITGYEGATVGRFPQGLPPLSIDLPWGALGQLLIPGVVIALVGFAEPASIARRFATVERKHWDPNRELLSQGLANIGAGIVGGLPVGGSFARSALNHQAGARTAWSGLFSGLVVLALLPLMPVIAPLPTSVLAAIIIGAAAGLIRTRPFVDLLRVARLQFGVAIVTLAVTLILAPRIDRALVVGVVLAIAAHLFREVRLSTDASIEGSTLHLHPKGVLYFGSVISLERVLLQFLTDHPEADRLVVHLDGLGRLDLTGALELRDYLRNARRAGLDVRVQDAPPQAMKITRRLLGEFLR